MSSEVHALALPQMAGLTLPKLEAENRGGTAGLAQLGIHHHAHARCDVGLLDVLEGGQHSVGEDLVLLGILFLIVNLNHFLLLGLNLISCVGEHVLFFLLSRGLAYYFPLEAKESVITQRFSL